MKKSKGFTLIEVFVVIVIVGLLAAIAIPYFGPKEQGIRVLKAYDTYEGANLYMRFFINDQIVECTVKQSVFYKADASKDYKVVYTYNPDTLRVLCCNSVSEVN